MKTEDMQKERDAKGFALRREEYPRFNGRRLLSGSRWTIHERKSGKVVVQGKTPAQAFNFWRNLSFTARALVCLVAMFFAGCATSQKLVTGKARPAIAAAQVEIRPAPPAGAEEIGLVMVTSSGHSNTAMERAVSELKKQSAALGANVLVITDIDLAEYSTGAGVGYSFGSPGITYTPSATARETKLQAKCYHAEK